MALRCVSLVCVLLVELVGCESINVYLCCVRISRYQCLSVPMGMSSSGALCGGLYVFRRESLVWKKRAVRDESLRAWLEK